MSLKLVPKRIVAHLATVARMVGAAFTTSLVGTWSTRRAVFVAVPRDMRTADPTRASDWMEGYITLAGAVVQLDGQSIFDTPPPTPAFARELHSFTWLKHARTYTDPALSNVQAKRLAAGHFRSVVLDWIARTNGHPAIAFSPTVTARRALCLTNHAAFLLDEAEPADYRTIMAAIITDMRRAFVRRSLVKDPSERCALVIACAAIAEALNEHVGLKRLTRGALEHALREAFYKDGSPVTRRPGDLPPLLADLLALQALIEARGSTPSAKLKRTIDDGIRMITMLRHPDGSLMRTQGTRSLEETEPDLIASVLFYDVARRQPTHCTDSSKWVRLKVGQTLLLMDAGPPPPHDASREAHASMLAIEWSHGGAKILTNAPELGASVDASHFEQRQTHAHSTVTLGQASSAVFSSRRDTAVLRRGGVATTVQVKGVDTTPSVTASHTGYRRRFGVDHWRFVSLHGDGTRLEGRDWLTKPNGQIVAGNRAPLSVRFQLQPGAKVDQLSDKTLVITVRHVTVHFEVDQGTIKLEDPSDRPGYHGLRPTVRVVVAGDRDGNAEITWRFNAATPLPGGALH